MTADDKLQYQAYKMSTYNSWISVNSMHSEIAVIPIEFFILMQIILVLPKKEPAHKNNFLFFKDILSINPTLTLHCVQNGIYP